MNLLFSVLAQGLPPITPATQGFDFARFIVNAITVALWSAVAAIIFTVVIIVTMRIFSALTPGIDELAELKNGNIAVGLVLVGFLLAVSAIVMAILVGG